MSSLVNLFKPQTTYKTSESKIIIIVFYLFVILAELDSCPEPFDNLDEVGNKSLDCGKDCGEFDIV